MPWKQWAYLEKVSSSDFQTYLQNQIIAVFTNAAQRDSVITSPIKGQAAYLQDTGTLTMYNGAAVGWTKPWGVAWGRLASVPYTANQTGIGTTVVTLTGLSLAPTVPAGRHLRIHAQLVASHTVVPSEARFYVLDNGGNSQYASTQSAIASRQQILSASWLYESDGAAHTYTMQASITSAGGGTLNVIGTGVPASFMAIYDEGPSASPT